MKLKKLLAVSLTFMLALSMVGCKGKDESKDTDAGAATSGATNVTEAASKDSSAWSYSSIKLGEDYTDLKATIKYLHCRTDRDSNSGGDGTFQKLIAEFNKTYPNITVETEGVTDYANESLLRLSTGDWGDVMFIPAVDKSDLSTYFLPYGTVDDVSKVANYVTNWSYEDKVYGIPCLANANGVLYNKAVFEKAGITTLPKTPDEFVADLKLVKDKTDAIPLYTNYFAQWTMGAWDSYVGAVCTGDFAYRNQKLVHTADPFKNPGDGTGAYNIYKILYDVVSQGLIEDDYTTTDWEGCKGMMNNGEIATMVLGSWAVSQMQQAGDHPDDIGYMPFPISVGGKQYVAAAPDYNYGINVNSSDDNKLASTIFVKWMTEKSGWAYSEGSLPVSKDGQTPELYNAFKDCVMQEQDPALAGEETLLNDMNAKSELNIDNGGNDKVMAIVDEAATKGKSFDDIMNDWNKKWDDAQKDLGIEVKY